MGIVQTDLRFLCTSYQQLPRGVNPYPSVIIFLFVVKVNTKFQRKYFMIRILVADLRR